MLVTPFLHSFSVFWVLYLQYLQKKTFTIAFFYSFKVETEINVILPWYSKVYSSNFYTPGMHTFTVKVQKDNIKLYSLVCTHTYTGVPLLCLSTYVHLRFWTSTTYSLTAINLSHLPCVLICQLIALTMKYTMKMLND